MANGLTEEMQLAAKSALRANDFAYPYEVAGKKVSEPPKWVWELRGVGISVQEGAWGYELTKGEDDATK